MNTKTMTDVYLLAQEHCGLKAGDWVKVLREPEKDEAGWHNMNAYDTSEMVGRIFKIDGIYSTGIAVIRDDGKFVSYFPYFVLEKVDKPEHKFKPFDRVLVRCVKSEVWEPDIFKYKDDELDVYYCISGWWRLCIPYEGNEHLAGTTNEPEE